ncbi:MAG: DUF4412 domain-containing protein [Chlorobi bacterium]|nr:DUF4412 domain-containing protein [Chlorobiota bacterium]
MHNLKTVIALMILFLTVNIFAGGVIKVKSTNPDGSAISEDIMYVQNGKIRFESNDPDDKTITIFDTQNGKMINIDLTDNTYMIITKDDFEKFAKKIAEVKKQQEKMISQLPEEQRAMMKQMLDKQMAQMKNPPKTEYNKKGSERLNGYDCDIYEGIKKGEKVEELWVASWDELKFKDEYVKVFEGIKDFFMDMAANMGELGGMMENEFDTEIFDKGFPVKTIEYENGQPVRIEIIEEVTDSNLSPALFEIPEGLTKTDPFEDM